MVEMTWIFSAHNGQKARFNPEICNMTGFCFKHF